MPGITATASPTRLDAVVLIRRTDGFVFHGGTKAGIVSILSRTRGFLGREPDHAEKDEKRRHRIGVRWR